MGGLGRGSSAKRTSEALYLARVLPYPRTMACSVPPRYSVVVSCFAPTPSCSPEPLLVAAQLARPDVPPEAFVVCENDPFGTPLLGYTVYGPTMAGTFTVQTLHSRSEAGVISEDVEVTTTSWAWTPAGDPTDAQFDIVLDALDAFWTGIAVDRSPLIRVDGHRVYVSTNPPSTPGPAVYTRDANIVGTGSGFRLPPQVATTITMVVENRRRWGRFYIGGLASTIVTTDGRLGTATRNRIANTAALEFSGLGPDWVLSVFGTPSPNTLPVTEVRVDDVFDVIRSRRYDVTTARAIAAIIP